MVVFSAKFINLGAKLRKFHELCKHNYKKNPKTCCKTYFRTQCSISPPQVNHLCKTSARMFNFVSTLLFALRANPCLIAHMQIYIEKSPDLSDFSSFVHRTFCLRTSLYSFTFVIE